MNSPRAFQLGKVRAELRWYLELLELELDAGTTSMVHIEPQVRLCEILHTLMTELGGATLETNGYRDQLQALTLRANAQHRKRARSSRWHLRVVGS